MKYKAMNKILCNDNNVREIVQSEIKRLGPKADLNHLDTSQVTDMTGMFIESKFTGDISKWNTSKVKYMSKMFVNSKFNGDIAKWDVSNVDVRYLPIKNVQTKPAPTSTFKVIKKAPKHEDDLSL